MCLICGYQNADKTPLNVFTDEDFERIALSIFSGIMTPANLDYISYIKTAEKLTEGIYSGYGKEIGNVLFNEPDYLMLRDLRENVYIFSGAKTYQSYKAVSALLTEGDAVTSYSVFRDKAFPILKEFNDNYLRAEYNSAIAQAQTASFWQSIEQDKESFPMLVYKTVGDGRVRPEHAELNGIARPVDDKFWNEYMPPNGWNCYDDKTYVYTDNGWKLFRDLDKTESVLTLNPESRNVEWQKPITYIEKDYDGELVNINSNNFSCAVTDKHKMLVRKSWDRKMKRKSLKLIDADSISVSDQIYKSSEWIGDNSKTIIVAGTVWKTEVFVKFMAWYLSEGSTTKRGENKYQIKISQSAKKFLNLIVTDLKDAPYNFYIAKDYVGLNNTELGKYLAQFGKSYEKWIPNEVKSLSKEYLELFIDRYVKGDGCVVKGVVRDNGYTNKDQYSIYTTSERMMGDLTEVVIKLGKSCNVSKRKDNGKVVKHRNGIYTTNHDIFRINITESVYYNIQKKHISMEHYKGKVYCVEVEKYNTLLVMRYGKIYWCGNCRCRVGQETAEYPKTDMRGFKSPDSVPDIFRFNSGKERIIFSKQHPYFKVAKKDKALAKQNFGFPLP